MCFSASASFAVGAGLLAPGYYSLSRAKATGMRLFASTPLLFSMHQTAEGFLWLSLQHAEYSSWYFPALYTYSFVSQPVWPVWSPLTMWLMETDFKRKKILFYFLLLGIAASIYMLYCLVAFGITATAESGHIRYYRDFPHLDIMRVVNFITVAVTPFLSTLRYMKLVASSMFVSLIIAYFFFHHYFISVWCFFAALFSLLIILVVRGNIPSQPGAVLK